MAKKPGARLADFQYAGATPGAPSGKRARRFGLATIDPHAKPFSSGDKAADQAAVDALAGDIDRLQDMLFADRRFKMLVVLQGTDTSGKDGTIRGVFSKTSALGVRTAAWKAPSEEERAHDFLWRIHQKVPAAGEIVIFNRSHYEDVLVPVVKGWIKPEETAQRFAQINDFERMLVESGTVIVKFLLHISKEEQRERLQERLDDPDKQWKFAPTDIEQRKKWGEYQRAYEQAIRETDRPHAPWYIVPANSKTHRNLVIASLLLETLEGMDLSFPPPHPDLSSFTVV